ncbi:MAG: nitroreductase family protein [Dehalococcoidia bacterium]|nr:nitroreductase family protein [Dehalococcoidia bacterium]
MDVHEAIRIRRSVRDFADMSVPDTSLIRVLEAARLAPSSSNRQNWMFIVVRDAERRREIAAAAGNQMWIAGAPIIIAAVATEPASLMTSTVPRYAVDVAIAVDHMTLAAAAEGLGTCWIGRMSQEKVCAILGVPETCKVVTVMPLGYPRSAATSSKLRKGLEEIVRYETYSP